MESLMENRKILVWDLPTRLFHWLLVASFTGAFLTAESERYRDVHVVLGYTVLGLILFRLLWAFIGTRYARLSSFAFGPKAVVRYLKSLLTRSPIHYVGHNPAGSWAIYSIVALALVTGITGYAVYNHDGGHWLEELHEGVANIMLALVIVHIMGVIVSSILHRENLAVAMITGYKLANPNEGIAKTRWVTAAILVCGVALLWSGVAKIPGLSVPSALKESTTHRGDAPRLRHHVAKHHD
jgi:cytochrome b